MKGDFVIKALEIIGSLACDTGDFIEAFLSSSKVNYSKLRNFHYRNSTPRSASDVEKNRYYVLLSRLKSAGLISKDTKNGSIWKITKVGENKLKNLKEAQDHTLPSNKYNSEGK